MRAKTDGVVALLVTASSRTDRYNGLKLIDKDGSPWSADWELICEMVVNSVDLDFSLKNLNEITIRGFPTRNDLFGLDAIPPPTATAQTLEQIEETKGTEPPLVFPHVFIACDTRSSSPALLDLAKHALESMRTPYTELREVTTPQLTYFMKHHAQNPKITDYVNGFCFQFLQLTDMIESEARQVKRLYEGSVTVDCANGLASFHMPRLAQIVAPKLTVSVMNRRTGESSRLNEECGAEYVLKTGRVSYEGTAADPTKTACLDGDGDRLIYYKRGERKALTMNGDKVFALIMMYIVEKLEVLQIISKVSHCLITTNYANSACTKFLEANDVNYMKVATGVRNAKPELKKYVIAGACDFSGHGSWYVRWEWLNKALEGKEDRIEAKKLRKLLEIGEAGEGDAMATMLMVEAVMRDKDLSAMMFYKLYLDLPSKICNAYVQHKNRFICNWDETELVEPKMLQDMVHVFTLQKPGSRAFIRPAGTENCLRVYVEAKTEHDVDEVMRNLLEEISQRYANWGADKQGK